MAQIPPIDDAYINEIIKSNGPYNPVLIKTQGTKMRELIKLLRDRMEQGDTGVVRTTGDQNIYGTKTFTLLKAEGISVNNLANPALNTVISPVNGVQTRLLNLSEGTFAVQLAASGLSALRSQTLQDKDGVIALTSDIQSERFNPIAGTGISLNGTYPNITINTTGIDSTPDATTLIRGKIRLSGDLAGNADAPTVPGLALKANISGQIFTGNISAPNLSGVNTGDQDLAPYQLGSEKGQPNGYAGLDSGAKIPLANLPDTILGQVVYIGTWNASANTPTLVSPPASSTKGHYYLATVAGTQFGLSFLVGDWIISNGVTWDKVDNTDAVMTVFGRIGNIFANASDYSAFYPLISGSYINPAWIESLPYSKLTGAPNLGDYVDRTTDQTVGGIKTFTGEKFKINIIDPDDELTDYRTKVDVSRYLLRLRNIDPGEEPYSREIKIDEIGIELRANNVGLTLSIGGSVSITGADLTIGDLSGIGDRIVTAGPTGLLSAGTSLSGYELLSNKQNSLTTDGTNQKYPTITAVNSGLATKANLFGGNVMTGTQQSDKFVVKLPSTVGNYELASFNLFQNNNPAGSQTVGRLTLGKANTDGSGSYSSTTLHPAIVNGSFFNMMPSKDGVLAVQEDLDLKAPLASPAFTGIVTAPTAQAGTNTAQIATTAFVQSALGTGYIPYTGATSNVNLNNKNLTNAFDIGAYRFNGNEMYTKVISAYGIQARVSTGGFTGPGNFYNISSDSYTYLGDASGGNVVFELPLASASMLGGLTYPIYILKKIDFTANTVTLRAKSSELIDGSNTYVLTNQYQSVTVQSDGTRWHVIAGVKEDIKYGATTVTFNGTATTFTIAHGMGVTPTSFALTFGNAGQLNFVQSVRTIDATNITFTCNDAPAAGSQKVYWQVFR